MLAPSKPATEPPLLDVAKTYWGFLGVYWQEMLGYGLAAVAIALLWRTLVGRRQATEPRVGERWLRLALVLGLIGLGSWRVHATAACFDDAYISLRYAENFVAGKGLVWNEGEYVEGYTNFLWTMLVSLFLWITPLEAPLIAVLGSMLAFAANLWVVWRISLKIAPPFHRHAFAFPIAVALLAVQNTFTDYGTSGLETAFASLLVNLGVLALIAEAAPGPGEAIGPGESIGPGEPQPPRGGLSGPQSTFWAGFCWILATLTRPDHAVFYAVGSAVVLGIWIRPTWHARKRGLAAIWREGLLPMATYAAPFVLWLIHSAWKLHYYGELLPNTYYAKSAYMTYYSQGLVYAASFHLGSHLWLVLLAVLLLWPWRPPSNTPARRFMAFAVPSILLYEWYVVRVGGDFMYGRFYVTLIPLILLCGEQVVHEYSMTGAEHREPDAAPRRARLRIGAIIMVGLMAASAFGIRMIAPRKGAWSLTDETTHYRIEQWSPIVISHPNYRVGVALGKINAGLQATNAPAPIIASGAIGLIGYYSNMTLIDRLGLTDATVAHQEIEKRGRPGHEKWADPAYVRDRGTHFVRGTLHPRWFRRYARIVWAPNTGNRRWYIQKYDAELMSAIRETSPDVYFQDFEIYIDRYIAQLPNHPHKKVRKDFKLFEAYYFNHNDAPERREAFTIYFQWVREGKNPRDLRNDGRWDVYKQRAVLANENERALREARAERMRVARGQPAKLARPAIARKPAKRAAPAGDDESGESGETGETGETGHDDDHDEHDDGHDDDHDDDHGDDAS